jgi:TetR/AcrR family transcriptional regulator, transcriptional repressor for nem operon
MMMNIILSVKRESRTVSMGHSQADKAESHDRIVRMAAARFREDGVDGIGVADLMKEAGLTHGGFYRHFASREALVDEAIERALHDGGKGALDAIAASTLPRQTLLFMLIDWYLGTAHRDNLATSCAVTSLAADVSRGSERARAAYAHQVGVYLDLFTRLIPGDRAKVRRTKAIAAWSTLVGALSMARAVNDDKLAREILKTAADELKARLAQPPGDAP